MDKEILKSYLNNKKGKKAKKGKRYVIKGTAGKGQRQTKVKGRTQAIIDILRQKKLTGFDSKSIEEALVSKGIKAPDTDIDFYGQILKMTYQNVKININDLLNGRRFNYYYYSTLDYSLEGNVFSNDKLFWLARLTKLVPKDILNLLVIPNMSLSLQTRCRPTEQNIQKGYIQDLSKNFCFIGKKQMEKYKTEDIADAALGDTEEKFKAKCSDFDGGKYNKIDFSYGSTAYKGFFFSEGVTLCYESGTTRENLIKYIDDVNVYENKTDYKSGFKILQIGSATNVFMSQKVKLVDFVPGSVVLKINLPYIYSIESEYDIAALDDYLRTREIAKKKDLDDYFLPDMVQWDTLDTFVNYVSILFFSTFIEKAEFYSKAQDFMEGYKNNKDFYDYYKKFVIMFKNFTLKFFDSFYNKINIDVCKSLLKQYNNKIKGIFSDIRDNAPEIDKLKELFEKCGLQKTCRVCYNCCAKHDDIFRILTNIVAVLEQIDNGIATNLESNLRSVGVQIFDIMRCSRAETYLLDEIRTPYIFLGNLVGNEVDFSKTVIESFVSKTIKTEYDKSSQIDIIKNYMTVNKPEKFKLGLAAILAAAKTDAINVKEKKFNPKYDAFYEEFVKEHSPEKNDDDTLRTIILGSNVKEDEALPNPKDFGIKDEDKQKIKEAYDNYLRKVGGYKAVFESEIKEDIAWLKDLEERFKDYDWSWLAKIKFEDKPEAETSVSKPKRDQMLKEITEVNTANPYFTQTERITIEKLKKLGIPTIAELTRGKIKDDNSSVAAWRELGVVDPIIYAFYQQYKQLPRIVKDIDYVDQLRKISQEHYGPGLAIGLKGTAVKTV